MTAKYLRVPQDIPRYPETWSVTKKGGTYRQTNGGDCLSCCMQLKILRHFSLKNCILASDYEARRT